jgi:hypothetical protein
MKTLEDARHLRSHILSAFEMAARAEHRPLGDVAGADKAPGSRTHVLGSSM